MADLYPVPSRVREGSPNPIVDLDRWREASQRAQVDPDGFWLDWTRSKLHWHTTPTIGCEGDFHTVKEEPIRWFADGKLDVTFNCVDRHAIATPDKVAILWEGDRPGETRRITYDELYEQVCRAANALETLGIKRG